MPSTSGFGVQVMPNIQFSDGAQLAGRGPGEAIAGFNSGIGAINAIQNTRNKAILAPIEQDAARARLAQIQADTELSQAQAPYRNALARIEMGKASLPIRYKQGESIVGVPEIGADGQPTGRIHQVIQDTGIEYDPTTQTRTPYTSMSKPLVTADQGSLNNSLIESRAAAAEAAKSLNEIRRANSDTSKARQLQDAQRIQDQFNQGNAKIDVSNRRLLSPHYNQFTTLDGGEVVVHNVDTKTGNEGNVIRTGQDPNRTIDPLNAEIAAQIAAARAKAAAGGTTTTTPAQTGGIRNWINNHNPFSSAPATDQPLTTLPVIPVGPASPNPGPPDVPSVDELSQYFTQPAVAPSNGVQSGRFTVRQK